MPEDEVVLQAWQDAGFYAVSYTVSAGAWEGLNDSTTVISYRGTDFPLDEGFGNDTDHGWSPALNNAATIHRVDMALTFA